MNVSDSRAVISYVERQYMTCSFQVVCKYTQNGLSERDYNACLEP